MEKPTKYSKGQRVCVDLMFNGTVRNIRFDDRGEAIYTIDPESGADLWVARECELSTEFVGGF